MYELRVRAGLAREARVRTRARTVCVVSTAWLPVFCSKSVCFGPFIQIATSSGGGGAQPGNGLLGMCRWMGSHFHDSTDYNGVAFSSIFNRVTRMGSHFFGTLRVKKSFA